MPHQINPEDLPIYDLIGFGSGIYSAKHHISLLNLADNLPRVTDTKAFIFSTAALTGEKKLAEDHLLLREKLLSKGYIIINEFQ